MSNEIFPTLPGLAWSVVKTPTWNTRVQQAVSGKEVRTAYRLRPIWKFTLTYEFLRGANGYTEYQTLLAFFNKRMGSFDSFLLRDASDGTVTAQAMGIGDGVTKTFKVMHQIGGWLEPVGAITGDFQPFINGTAQSFPSQFTTPSLNADSVTFAIAPAAGASITWTGTFYYRVRFAKDELEFDQFMKDFWLLKKCELAGVI